MRGRRQGRSVVGVVGGRDRRGGWGGRLVAHHPFLPPRLHAHHPHRIPPKHLALAMLWTSQRSACEEAGQPSPLAFSFSQSGGRR